MSSLHNQNNSIKKYIPKIIPSKTLNKHYVQAYPLHFVFRGLLILHVQNILIINKSKEILKALQLFITSLGYEATAVSTIKDFYKQVGKKMPSLFIIDSLLQEGDGNELCNELKTNDKTKHILILMTTTNPELLKKVSGCKADELLQKPFTLKALQLKIGDLIKKISAL